MEGSVSVEKWWIFTCKFQNVTIPALMGNLMENDLPRISLASPCAVPLQGKILARGGFAPPSKTHGIRVYL